MPRVLLVTPYSPLVAHDHAAQDIALPLMRALASRVDLHVYAADGRVNGPHRLGEAGQSATFHAAAPLAPLRRRHRLSTFPYRARREWQPIHDREVRDLVGVLRPDVVHAEYSHPAGVVAQLEGVPRTGTLHDIEERVLRREVESQRPGPRKVLALYDHRLVARRERRYVESLDQVFVFSERDEAVIAGMNPHVESVNLGVERPSVSWQPADGGTLLFAGAMWRQANVITAEFLVNAVMPLVWRRHPDARLRIVGAGPTSAVRALESSGRVDVVGEVSELDDEFAVATVNLAPSMVPAGILMKAIRAMSIGCPTVLNLDSAQPIAGARSGVNCEVGADAGGLAAAIVGLLDDQPRARRLGQAGRELVLDAFSWEKLAETYATTFRRLAGGPP